ncbi:carboxypeptidase-like regulatory domain-containing protein [Longimicrobium sp.]|uniref:carboxypeptidase-like regulatory domain-containing protein n=1 Tax=Longimicrobium sp. TaxID=2029185 RepID=UPI003B3B730F
MIRTAPARLRLLLAAILAAFATPAGAQVGGRVVDSADRPVAGAIVELWRDARAAGRAETDEGGGFRIGGVDTDGGMMLTVRRIGLRTRTVALEGADTALVVRMEVQPVVLQPLSVAATHRPPCPNAEDPRARALWERMRGRYWRPSEDSVFVFGFLETRSGTGAKADVYDPRAGRVTVGWTTGALIIAHPEFMALSGYATSAAGGVGDRTAYWSYRALDGGAMQDFTGDHFGAAHTFSIVHLAADGMTIAFCPRGRMGRTGRVEGTLVLAADTTLQSARWAFRTPRPDEDAGGEASYGPPAPELGNALLARESMFWRKTNPPRYYFEAQTFTGWQRWTRDRPVTHPDQARPAAQAPGDGG